MDDFPKTTLVPRAGWTIGTPPIPEAKAVANICDGQVLLYWGVPDQDGCWLPYQELKDGRYGPPYEIEWPFGSEDIAPNVAYTQLGFIVEEA
jgi:hypothetical protein